MLSKHESKQTNNIYSLILAAKICLPEKLYKTGDHRLKKHRESREQRKPWRYIYMGTILQNDSLKMFVPTFDCTAHHCMREIDN